MKHFLSHLVAMGRSLTEDGVFYDDLFPFDRNGLRLEGFPARNYSWRKGATSFEAEKKASPQAPCNAAQLRSQQ
ncbi:MAG: hypothetical protein C0404_03790 [Verrucomicrobia bacterium]|nr:hypothetical protein [Verrucomicrobiota bacterium]